MGSMQNGISVFKPEKTRIASIDVVRAIVLLGIFIVHTRGGFGFNLSVFEPSFLDCKLNLIISKFLVNKCAVVFNVLFGVSFYFILRKPGYPSRKFVWRCVLLFGFGMVNKIFYTYDALCWYAIWGCVLVLFKRCKPLTLFFWAMVFKLLAHIVHTYTLGTMLFDEPVIRYDLTNSFWNILLYPYALVDYLRIVFNSGIFGCLSNFLIGYGLAQIGLIDKVNQVVTWKVALGCSVLYILLYVAYRGDSKPGYYNLYAGLTYASIVVCAYNSNLFHGLLHYLEAYGKLGLTNYSIQSVFGVCFVYAFRNTIMVRHLSLLLLVMLVFYVGQAVFSHYWLLNHKYGPLEYLWRSFTDMNFKGNKIETVIE